MAPKNVERRKACTEAPSKTPRKRDGWKAARVLWDGSIKDNGKAGAASSSDFDRTDDRTDGFQRY